MAHLLFFESICLFGEKKRSVHDETGVCVASCYEVLVREEEKPTTDHHQQSVALFRQLGMVYLFGILHCLPDSDKTKHILESVRGWDSQTACI